MKKTSTPPPKVSEPPLFHLIYRFYLEWYVLCRSLPKLDRFTIGEKVSNLLLEILTQCVIAYHTKEQIQKRKYLTEMNISFEAIKVLIRLAKDTRAIDRNAYIRHEEKLQTMGKMIGGWIVSIPKTGR